jgi:hypothetical protein
MDTKAMMNKLRIRRARLDDIPTLQELIPLAYRVLGAGHFSLRQIGNSSCFPSREFIGLIVLLPQYFFIEKNNRDFPPAITHPEYSKSNSKQRRKIWLKDTKETRANDSRSRSRPSRVVPTSPI